MPDLIGGETFVDGQSVNGSRLNAHVNNAQISEDFVNAKPLVAPVAADHVVFRQNSTGLLKKATVGSIQTSGGAVTSVGLTMPTNLFNVTGSPVTTSGVLAAAFKPIAKNLILVGPPSGVDAVPTLRLLKPPDMASFFIIPALEIDLSITNFFFKQIGANTTFNLTHGTIGQTIKVSLLQSGNFTVTWTAANSGTIRWPGGTNHTLTTGAGAIDLVEFTCVGNSPDDYLATFNKNFSP